MAKAGFQTMRAAQEFLAVKGINIKGWIVSGASKRGWTTWAIGAATCESCVNILGIVPMVPIVPNMVKEIHRQWQSYGGFTFAFSDYTVLNLTMHVDDPIFQIGEKIVDPAFYPDRLARLPKLVILSSDDEFMQLDWSNIWWEELRGEKHLLIAPNSEHSLLTALPKVIENIGAFAISIANGETEDDRPSFSYFHDNSTGELTVDIPKRFFSSDLRVTLRHAETLQTIRRDFRWVRLASNDTQPCVLPEISLPKPIFGGNCLVPIIWHEQELKADPNDGKYHAPPPEPSKNGRWVGYYIEAYFPTGDGFLLTPYQFTTPAFVWPDTLPFDDCHGSTCTGRLL
jgi:PhoPQ-activated pathogenicity-related protein